MSAKTQRMERRLKAHKTSAVLTPNMVVKAGTAKIGDAIYVELIDGRVAALPDTIEVFDTGDGKAELRAIDVGTIVTAPVIDESKWRSEWMQLLDGRIVRLPAELRMVDLGDGNALLLPAEPAWRIEAGQVLRRGEKVAQQRPVVCLTCGR